MRRGRISYSLAEMAWLEENRSLIISEYHAAFCVAFERTDITATHLHGLRKRKGWKVGRAPGRLAGRHLKFSTAEIAWLRDNATMMIGDYHKAFCSTFGRVDMTAQKLHGLRKRKKWKTGRSGRFDKGAVPWSKGKTLGNNPGSARTQFRVGQLPHNTKCAGHERVNVDGYVEISVDEVNPHTGYERRYVHKHRWLWERLHGLIPGDMVLKCKGDRLNSDPSNWELVPRAILPRLNGQKGTRLAYDAAPGEIRPTILAIAKLEHQVRKKTTRRPTNA